MTREYGTPIFFLTFSCAEYASADIELYCKVNDVPEQYPIGKLCAEDPIAVSWKFSQKFHDFFNTALRKGQVLGKVNHYFWKKRVPIMRSTTLPCIIVDRWCTHHWP